MSVVQLKEKLCSLAEAAKLIKNGSRITFGGFTIHNHPMAFIYELIRQGVKDLTIVGFTNGNEVDILVGAGCVKRIETCYVGLEKFGVAPNFRRAVEKGEIEVVEYSEDLAIERFQCSARGDPFIPSRILFGSDIPKYNRDIKEGVSPLDGGKYHAIPPADPEWVIVHTPMGDRYGNALYFPNMQLPMNWDLVMTRTTNKVIVTVEQIIDRERVLRLSHLNMIPRFRNVAIVEAPYGAHPSSYLQLYNFDAEHLTMYARLARDPAEFKKYLDKYVYGVKSHLDYLKLIGVENLMKIRHVGGGL